MQIRNFNQVEPVLASTTMHSTGSPEVDCDHGSMQDTEIALLRARIEHLELVVETARSLMTANQERLLRRLHDLPQEMMNLTARMTRQASTDPGRGAQQGSRP